MPNISGSFTGKAVAHTFVELPDTPNHQLNFGRVEGVQSSPDPNWNGGKLIYWASADLVAGNGAQRGYFVNEHTDGDRDCGSFEGKITTSGNNVTLEGRYTQTGGTGKYKGMTGGGTYKGQAISPTEIKMTWEGAYELASAARAAG